MRKICLALPLFLLLLSVPGIGEAAESMSMVQIGISGAITAPDIVLADLAGDGTSFLLTGTSTGLYVFSGDGELYKYIQTPSPITNIAVLGDMTNDGKKEVAISTGDAYFPNVQCFDIENDEKLWEFSPKTEVYDPYILWTMKQTSVFDMDSLNDLNSDGHDDLVLSSGYVVYTIDGKTGEKIWQWQDSDNVWDLLVIGDQNGDGLQDILAGDQNGYLYLISGLSGNEIWKKYLAKIYTVVNPSTNSPAGTVKRSVWDLVGVDIDGEQHVAVSAEDGFVYMIDTENGEIVWEREIIEYVDTLLYSYYGDSPIPTGIFSYNFFNLRIVAVDDVSGDGNSDLVASSFPGFRFGQEYKGVRGLHLIDSGTGEVKWSNENIELGYVKRPGTVEMDETFIAVPIGKSGAKDKIRLVDPDDGSIHDTLTINSSPVRARGDQYFLSPFEKNRFVMASNYGDFALVEEPQDVVWSYPRINEIVIEKADFTGDSTTDMLVKSRDGADSENPFDEGQSRVIFVIDGATMEIAWSYTLPFMAFSETGGLSGVQIAPDINKDGKSDILAYLQYPGEDSWGDTHGEKTRILLFSGKSGVLVANRSVAPSRYYGIYDSLFKDPITFNQSIRVGMLKERGLEESHLMKMDLDQREDFDREYEEMKRNILENENELKINKRVQSLDIINDQSGDGVPDFILGLLRDVFIMDSVSGEIIWNRTSRESNYRNPFTHEVPEGLKQNLWWVIRTGTGRMILCWSTGTTSVFCTPTLRRPDWIIPGRTRIQQSTASIRRR
jgi:outer membrane protein assembly factor BamB